MGRLRIKPQKMFVKTVMVEPSGRARQWFIATMFTLGVVATIGAIGFTWIWIFRHVGR